MKSSPASALCDWGGGKEHRRAPSGMQSSAEFQQKGKERL